jgi:large subunit ribosomal protein L15
MKTKKRTKASRIRGARTCGWGFRQSHKGHGCGGGFGMAGTGKRGDQSKQKASDLAKKLGFKSYFGKQGMTSASTKKRKVLMVNLAQIKDTLFEKDGQEIKLEKYKILGNGEGFKGKIIAMAATNSAIEKMKKAGGEIVLPVKKVETKKEAEKKVEKKSDGEE